MIATELFKADLVRSEIGGMVLAQPDFPGGEKGGQGPGFGKSSPVGLFLLIALLVAVAFLVRSMTKHLKKVTTSFDQDRATAAAPKRVKRAEMARARAAQDSQARQDTAVGGDEADDEPESDGVIDSRGGDATDDVSRFDSDPATDDERRTGGK